MKILIGKSRILIPAELRQGHDFRQVDSGSFRWEPPTSSRGSKAFKPCDNHAQNMTRFSAGPRNCTGLKPMSEEASLCRRTGGPAPPDWKSGAPTEARAAGAYSRHLFAAFSSPQCVVTARLKPMPLCKASVVPSSIVKASLTIFSTFLLLSSFAFSQNDKFQGVVTQGVERVRIAVADFKPTTSDPNTAALQTTFNQVLFSDLENAGIFD